MHTNAGLFDLWVEPQQRECLPCYVTRMLTDFGCDGTMRWTRRWRALRTPEVTALDRTFRRHRTRCDCGVPAALGTRGAGSHHTPRASDPPPPCAGVRRGSTRPCTARGRPPPPSEAVPGLHPRTTALSPARPAQ